MLLGIPLSYPLIHSTSQLALMSIAPRHRWLTRLTILSTLYAGIFVISVIAHVVFTLSVKTLVESTGRTWVFPCLPQPLLTLPQFILLQYVKDKTENWPTLSAYENIIR